MSSFADQLASDRDNVVLRADERAESVTYTTPAGAASTVTAVLGRESITEEQMNDGFYHVRRRECALSAAEVTPSIHGKLTAGGVVYWFEGIDGPSAMGVYKLKLRARVIAKDMPTEFSAH